MADQIPFGVVEHILIKLGSLAVQEIRSMYGVPKELTRLKEKLDTINAVLLDAEEKQQKQQQQQKNHGVEVWVQKLKGVVYDTDDLLDDYATHYLQQGGFARQVSDFFSSENQVAFRLNMSHRLKDIKERIDHITEDIPMLNLIPRDIILLQTRVENNPRETHSFVLTTEIVGRDENKEEIIGKLLSSYSEENLSAVAIVGIGGLGKTTLAQLVYNDGRVKEHFEPKIWACISDESGDGFDVSMWIKKIFKSMNVQFEESLEDMKNKLHEKISQKRYLIVIDDVWNENPEKWDGVRTLLMVGAIGSKIIVTTRKPVVASTMGDKTPISLKGLDENESWNLFSKMAFRDGEENVHTNLVKIGKEIANMCKGVPLIIKTLGRILQSKREEGQWLSIRKNENLLSLRDGNDNVLKVLKLSYDNLPTHLRQCFTYCALFPKDYKIERKSLVQQWIAQGYIQSSNDNNEQLEDIGDQYFEELLSRSLLEEVEKDAFNNTLSYQMHDLIHDLAQLIIGSEVLILTNDITNIPDEVRHVSLFEELNPMIKALKGKPIWTFVNFGWDLGSSTLTEVLPSFKSLRVLSLERFGKEKMSTYLGKLSHLRYLDLSYCDFEVPPNAITRLKNLQTLKLNDCRYLQRFPKDTRKLINLRHLEYRGCVYLTCMPHGIGELTLLQSLPLFVVGDKRMVPWDHKIGSLMELKMLNQISGGLQIEHLQNVRNAAEVSKGEILKEKKYLESLRLVNWGLPNRDQEGTSDVDDELVMEGLQPHPNLKELFIERYGGRRFPSWMMNDGLGSLLPNLITIKIRECSKCQILPPFSQLPFLQSVDLYDMREVEGMKKGSSATNAEFFPALQFLKLYSMPKLKGLWRMELGAEQGLSFPCLSQLDIDGCSNLTSIQLSSSPSLSTITISDCDNLISLQLHSSSSLSLSTLQIDCLNLTSLELPSSPCLSHLNIQNCLNLTSLKVVSLPCLEHLSLERVREEVLRQIMFVSAFSSLKFLSLRHIDDTTCISLLEQLLQHVSTLQTLKMWNCPKLMTSLPQEMPSLKTLQKLKIDGCSGLATLPHWIGSLTLLEKLCICSCPELTSLPEEIHSLKTLQVLKIYHCSAFATLQYSIGSLTSLKELRIRYCPKLTSLPEEMRSLNNLQMLRIEGCPHVKERCQKETGDDWSKISHIPCILIHYGWG